jgi:hypothetical protein
VAGHGGAVAACGAARLGVLHGAREGRRPRAYKSAAPAARSEEGMGDRGGQLGYGGGQRPYHGEQGGVRRRDSLGRGQGAPSVCAPPRDGAVHREGAGGAWTEARRRGSAGRRQRRGGGVPARARRATSRTARRWPAGPRGAPVQNRFSPKN